MANENDRTPLAPGDRPPSRLETKVDTMAEEFRGLAHSIAGLTNAIASQGGARVFEHEVRDAGRAAEKIEEEKKEHSAPVQYVLDAPLAAVSVAKGAGNSVVGGVRGVGSFLRRHLVENVHARAEAERAKSCPPGTATKK